MLDFWPAASFPMPSILRLVPRRSTFRRKRPKFRFSVRIDCDLTGFGFVREEEIPPAPLAITVNGGGRTVYRCFVGGSIALSESDYHRVLSC